jgi:hypothetical protein
MELLAQARPARLDPDPGHAPAAGATGVALRDPVTRAAQGDAAGRLPGREGAAGRLPGQEGAAGRPSGREGAAGRLPGREGAAGGLPGQEGAAGRLPGREGAGGRLAGLTGARLRPAVAGAGVALASGVTAVAVLAATGGLAAGGPAATGGPAGSGPGHAAAPAPAPAPSAREILLTAAAGAARQPATGRYWRVALVSGSVIAAGPNAHPYAVEQRWSPEVTWDARSPHERTWTFPAKGYRSAPATAGAAAAWRSGGSARLPSSRGAQQAWWQTGGAVGYLGNGNLTSAQFRRLPSRPGALAAVVRTAAEQQVSPSTPPGAKSWREARLPSLREDMFGVYTQLLKLDPIAPAVRAAVFRDLAGLPGVRSIGKVTDPLGRAGYGIEQAQGGGAQPTEEVLVIAPGSGLLLADEFDTGHPSPPVPLAPSGALPGLARCPKGTATALYKPGHQFCKLSAAQARQLPASDGADPEKGNVLVGTGPIVQLAPGQVQSYDAIVSAGWTNASPALPPHSQRFSVTRDGKG